MTDLDGVKLAVTVKPLEWVSHLALPEVMVARRPGKCKHCGMDMTIDSGD